MNKKLPTLTKYLEDPKLMDEVDVFTDAELTLLCKEMNKTGLQRQEAATKRLEIKFQAWKNKVMHRLLSRPKN